MRVIRGPAHRDRWMRRYERIPNYFEFGPRDWCRITAFSLYFCGGAQANITIDHRSQITDHRERDSARKERAKEREGGKRERERKERERERNREKEREKKRPREKQRERKKERA